MRIRLGGKGELVVRWGEGEGDAGNWRRRGREKIRGGN